MQRNYVCGHVPGSQRSRNIAVFGHRFCGSYSPFPRALAEAHVRRSQGPLASLSQSRKSFSPSPLLPLPGRSFRSSNTAIQISQPDFIPVSRIFFIAPGPGASLPLFRPLPRLRARAPYVTNAGNSVYAQSTRRGGLQVRPHVRGLLIGQFTRCTFSYSARSHGDAFTDRYKTPVPLPNVTYSIDRLSNYLFRTLVTYVREPDVS